MRCMTKGLSLHGLGLYIYAGEDLPEEPQQDSSIAIKYIDDSQTLDELKGHYTAAYSIFSTDKSAMALITKAKDARKLALTEIKND